MSEQRRRNLEEQRASVETRRTILEERILSAGTTALPEWSHELSRLETRARDIAHELALLAPPDVRQAAYQRAVDLLGQWFGELKTRIDHLEKKLDIVAAGILLLMVFLIVDVAVRVLWR